MLLLHFMFNNSVIEMLHYLMIDDVMAKSSKLQLIEQFWTETESILSACKFDFKL